MMTLVAALLWTTTASFAGEGPSVQGIFVENRGQWPEHVEFAVLWTAGERRGTVRAERGRIVLQVEDLGTRVREVVAYEIEGGAEWGLEGRGAGARHHAFVGNDSEKWVRDAVAFERLVYLDADGRERLEVLWSSGRLEFTTAEMPVRLLRNGEEPLDLSRTLEVSTGTTLEAAKGVVWGTYFGGAMGWLESFQDAKLSPGGDRLLVAGVTNAPDFPVTPGVYSFGPPTEDFRDIVFVCFDVVTGELRWSTTIGGAKEESSVTIALAPDGSVVFGARSQSDDFPTTEGALFPTQVGASAVGALSADGDQLLFSTYFLGGLPKIGLRSDGSIAIGDIAGADAPVTPGAFDSIYNGNGDAYVAVLAADGASIVWASFLGTADPDYVEALVVLPDDAIAVTGRAGNGLFPTTPGAYVFKKPPLTGSGGIATFVTVFEPDGSALRWSSLIGGAIGNFNPPKPYRISVGHDGRIAIAGEVRGPYLPPIPNAAQSSFSGSPFDGFVLLLSPDGSSLLGGTYTGGAHWDYVFGLSFDQSGLVMVTGRATLGTPVTTPDEFADVLHVARLTPDLARYLHSQVMAGSTSGAGILPTARGRVAVVGTTFSTTLPTTPGAVFPEFQGGQADGFAMLHTMLPKGVVARGRSGPSCAAEAYLGAVGPAQAGNAGFALYASGLPPLAPGWLALGHPAEPAVYLPGMPPLHVDPAAPFILLPWNSGPSGYAVLDVPLPPATAGLDLAAQVVVLAPLGCQPSALAWTHALRMAISP